MKSIKILLGLLLAVSVIHTIIAWAEANDVMNRY